MLYSAKLVFTIQSSEVFALRGDLLYIFYGNCWGGGHSESSLVRGNLEGLFFEVPLYCSSYQCMLINCLHFDVLTNKEVVITLLHNFYKTTVPQNIVNVDVKPIYDSNSQLSEVRVHWRNQVFIIIIVNKVTKSALIFQFPSISERCDYDRTVNYTVDLVNSTGEMVDQRTMGSDSCTDGLCSTSFSPSSSHQTYHVSVSATNVFGESSTTSSITISEISLYTHSSSLFCF